MPASPARKEMLDAETYLQGEAAAQVRHEYVDGSVYAMAGANERHNRIALNIAFHLRAAARGTACGVFISDMKLRVEAHNAFYYPDVLLTCAVDDREELYKSSPCLVVEVLSDNTELIDRREKLISYRTLPSLQSYLLVNQNSRLVEHYRRTETGWQYLVHENDGQLVLSCGELNIQLNLADIYEDVALPDAGNLL